MRKIHLSTAALVVVALTSVVSVGVPGTSAAAAPDPLVGTWDTGPIPIRKIRAVLVAARYKNSRITSFFKEFGVTKAMEFKIAFYREKGVPFSYKKFWDPSQGAEPDDADHGPYRLLPNHRYVVRGVTPPTDRIREVFSYKVTGKRLKLTLVSNSQPPDGPIGSSGFRFDLVRDMMVLRVQEAFPYKKVD